MKAIGFETLEFRGERRRRLALAFLITFTLLAAWVNIAAATGAGTSIGALPWEKTLSGIAYSLTGPVALALSLVMVVVGIGVLMFGGDMAGWARWVAFAALAAGTLGGATNLVAILGVTGALI
ncbi:MAG: TrbC/VirB2 family protein [Synergistaceae bacterium]|nr:TrbC/VirB2 family protein [Synergistaceae bacterium]